MKTKRRKLNKKYDEIKTDDKDQSGDEQSDKDQNGDEQSDEDWLDNDYHHKKSLDENSLNEMKRIQTELKRSEPCLEDILNSNILIDDKTELLQVYEIYKSLDIGMEKLELRKKFIKLFDQFKTKITVLNNFSQKERSFYVSEINKLNLISEKEELKYKILSLKTSYENKSIIFSKYQRLMELSSFDEEYSKLKLWLEWAISLPYNIKHEEKLDIPSFLKTVRHKLDQEFYGMEKTKEQILLFLNSRLLNPMMKKCSLGLVGSPGCGKTSIIRFLSNVLNIPLQQISLGGINSPDFFKGHSYTYIGSEPGEIIKCMRRLKINNGILFFDEFEKVSNNKEICSSLLHITDPVQNNNFQDNYLSELTIDLSNLWLIYSMNSLPEDKALKDRIFYIYLDDYNREDKYNIIQNFLVPKTIQNVFGKTHDFQLEDKAVYLLIDKSESVRQIENKLIELFNKLNFLIYNKKYLKDFKVSFNLNKNIEKDFKVSENDLLKLLF